MILHPLRCMHVTQDELHRLHFEASEVQLHLNVALIVLHTRYSQFFKIVLQEIRRESLRNPESTVNSQERLRMPTECLIDPQNDCLGPLVVMMLCGNVGELVVIAALDSLEYHIRCTADAEWRLHERGCRSYALCGVRYETH